MSNAVATQINIVLRESQRAITAQKLGECANKDSTINNIFLSWRIASTWYQCPLSRIFCFLLILVFVIEISLQIDQVVTSASTHAIIKLEATLFYKSNGHRPMRITLIHWKENFVESKDIFTCTRENQCETGRFSLSLSWKRTFDFL